MQTLNAREEWHGTLPSAMGNAARSVFTTKFEVRGLRLTERWYELPECL